MTKGPGATYSPNLARPQLVDQALAASGPIVLVCAPAGMGKSWLLHAIAERCGVAPQIGAASPAPAATAVWDIPPDALPQALPETFIAGAGRLYVAKRPETPLPGLERARAYGRVSEIDPASLKFRERELALSVGATRAREIVERTGGWPALAAALVASPQSETAAAYCFAEWFRGESEEALAAAQDAFEQGETGEVWAAGFYRDEAASALRAECERRRREPARALRLAAAYQRLGRTPWAVAALQAAGLEEEALSLFAASGGWGFLFYFGQQAFDAALAGFSDEFRRERNVLVLALAFQALKRGDGARARRIFSDRFGAASQDWARVFHAGSPFPPAVRCFYLAMTLYEEPVPSDESMASALATLDELSIDAHLLRGNVYNAALEFYIRENRFAEAEDFAERALRHYEQAGAPLLSFYICVHSAVIRLAMGELTFACARCAAARDHFARVPFDSPGDARILALLEACLRYEAGHADALMTFLTRDLEDFASGETWPSLLELAVNYGAQALGEHYSTRAALAFAERWSSRHGKSRTLKQAIALRTIVILQSANRWDDAEAALGGDGVRVSRERLMSGTLDLARLRDRESLRASLAWMRQLAYRAPKAPGLERRLAALRDNLELTPRQRVGVEIWIAYVQRMNRNLSRARIGVRAVLEGAAQSGAIAPLAEERIFLAELLAQRQISDFVEASAPARQALRKLQDTGFSPSPTAARLGLTRQETRMLLLACRGATNKDAAKTLRLSEATVKFHLGNAYRKLGCRRRAEATTAAVALGLTR